MKKGNRLGALLLVAVMVFSLLPVAALEAADEELKVEIPLGEEVAELAELPKAAGEPSAPAELLETAGMKEQSSDGLTVSFVKYTGYEGFGETRTEVEKDDLTLVAAKVQWTAVDGATGYTVEIASDEHEGLSNRVHDGGVVDQQVKNGNTVTYDPPKEGNLWYQDNEACTVRLTNLHPGTTYTVTVTAQGAAASGSMTFTTKTATNALAEIAAADPEAPAAYGALPDDNQLTYHDSELAAFIHYGPNTFNNRSWGTGNESPADFAPTALNQDVVDGWVKQFQDAGFKRLIFVAKHHDGFCLWFSDYTDHDLDAEDSGYHYDLLEQVSKACTKYDMDMGFYISPWDAYETPGNHNLDGKYGTEAYNEHYLNTLREVLDSKANGNKYGNHGKFVEVWMDGAKGSNVQQSNDFDTWFQVIHELQPECVIFSPRADGGVRWVGNEGGYSGSNENKNGKGDISWQKVDPANRVVSGTLAQNICDPDESDRFPRQYGKPDGVLWSVNECDVSIESEWFWHSGNTLKTMDALASMYFESVGYGSPFLLNVPPTTTGSFASASANRLAEFGREVKNSFATDFATGKTATAGSTRASATAGKFGAANVVDDDPDNYWTMDDAAWEAWKTSSKTPGAAGSASVTVELGETKTFDVVSVQEFIPLGQRIISGVAEYRDADGNWQEFGTFHTVGARRLIRAEPVNGDAVRVTINESYAVPLIRSIGVYKVTRAMSLGDGLPAGMTYIDDRDSSVSYAGGWTNWDNDAGIKNTHKGSGSVDATATVTFSGTKFYVLGIVDPGHGPVEVTIDGQVVGTFDTHGDTRATKQVLYVSPDLTAGEHTVIMKAKTGTYGDSQKTYFDFDGICYLPGSQSILEFEKAEYTVFPSSSVDLKVKRSGDTSGTVTFQFSDQPGTAIQGDYVQMGETYTMAPGETEKVITMHTTAGAVSGGSPIGKNFYGILADPTGAILGFTAEATVTIVDPDTVPQEPKGETYTADDPFQFPTVTGKSRKLEAEYMTLDATNAVVGNDGQKKYIRISDDANASNGKKLGWFEQGNKAILHYNAPRAGVYTVTLRYQSGRPTDSSNDNKVNWRGQNVEDFSGTIPGLGGNGSNYGEHSYQLTVTEVGSGSIEFYADASACPNIDWITFRLDTPAVIDTTALQEKLEAAEAAKEGVTVIDNKTEAEVDKGVTFVTAAEMKALNDAIAAAETARDAENKTDASVAQALTDLNDAVEAFADAVKTGTKTGSSGSTSRPSTSTSTETKEDGTKVTTVTKPDGTVTETTETPDGAKAVVETKPDGSKTQTVEQADGTKSEMEVTKDGDVTITVTYESGEELVKTEIPAEIPEPEAKFEDVDATPWAEEAIDKMAGLKLVEGTGDNKYSPVAPMTRGSLATVLHRLSQGKTDYEVTFKDVAEGKYYTEGVAWAAKANVVKGVSEDVFAPDDIITREQLAVMLARYAKLVGLNTKADAKALESFTDGEKTGAWAVDGVAWCVENGILRGKGRNDLDPTAKVTRAEVAVMLDRFIALLK